MLDKDPPVFFPRDENNKLIITDTDYVDTYRVSDSKYILNCKCFSYPYENIKIKIWT